MAASRSKEPLGQFRSRVAEHSVCWMELRWIAALSEVKPQFNVPVMIVVHECWRSTMPRLTISSVMSTASLSSHLLMAGQGFCHRDPSTMAAVCGLFQVELDC